ncbi:MAG: tetratricopeptide repeat protein [Vicinamibacterales bacterium]
MAVLVLVILVSVPQGQDLRAEAERLAKSGARQEALERFQALAAENPADIAARLWIARLHLEMDHPERAAAVYESIVAAEAQNVEALVGLGLALTRTGRLTDASDALARAESINKDRVDLLSAQGALHTIGGRSTLALAYYGRALAIDPTNQAARTAIDILRAARAHRMELDYDFQTFNVGRDDTHTGAVMGNFRINDAVRVFGKAQVHDGALDAEARGGGGIEWMARPRVWLRVGALFGGNTIELPKADTFAEVAMRHGRATWSLEGRFVEFDGTDLWIGGPRVVFALQPDVTAFAAYQRGITRFDFDESSISDNVTLGVSGAIGRRLAVSVEYRHGIDRLDWITLDRVDEGDANTIGLGMTTHLSPFVALDARYDYQRRPQDVHLQRVHAGFVYRF